MKAKLIVLSPVHIGSSREDVLSQAVDFVYKNNKVILIDHEKLQKALGNRSTSSVNLEEVFIAGLRSGSIQRMCDFLNRNNISLEEVKLSELTAQGQIRGSINRMINSNGRVFIPGSSIKGLFRTALAYEYLKNDFKMLKESVNYVVKTRENPKKAFEWLGKKIFLDSYRDPLKNILVSDTEPFELKNIGVFATTRIYLKNFQKGPPIPVEAIISGASTSFGLKTIPFKVFKREFSFLERPEGLLKVFEAVNSFTKALLKREINELSKAGNAFLSIVNQYNKILSETNRLEGECIGRIGFGKTFFDETVVLLLEENNELELLKEFEDYLNYSFWKRKVRGKFIPRRRSIAKGDYLPSTRLFVLDNHNNLNTVLGWVKITPIS